MEKNKKSGGEAANLPSEMAYRGQLHASEAQPEAQLGDSAAKAMSLGGSVVAIRTNPSSIHQVESIQSVGSIGSIASIHPKKKQHSLLVLPPVHAIINFATKFFEMFTKKQSEHPHTVFQVFQVFQVFRVFQVFHFAFGPQNRPVLVQIRTNSKNRHPPASAI